MGNNTVLWLKKHGFTWETCYLTVCSIEISRVFCVSHLCLLSFVHFHWIGFKVLFRMLQTSSWNLTQWREDWKFKLLYTQRRLSRRLLIILWVAWRIGHNGDAQPSRVLGSGKSGFCCEWWRQCCALPGTRSKHCHINYGG